MIVKVGVSILSLDYNDITVINQALMRVDTANSVHLDVMDGKFVPQKTFDHTLLEKIDTKLNKIVHLMVKQPEKIVDKYIKAGAEGIIFHIEAIRSPKKLIEHLKKKKVSVGIALNPETPLKKIEKILPDVDLVLVMTVKPGKGGQKMMKTPLKKVKSIRKKYPMKDIAVDGGINADTAYLAIEAGANILVSGSYIFNSNDPKLAIDLLRNA
ncbi:MAG: ribulose-phosphate 3-epimerase [Nanoarchaeota archaeon]|nr:ribulose-phosphate 3-epimerase [Nanoarchaeota archaeon]MBU1321466.1 ribulose-phosphate 3-epimerase [Nanoarchaeota archaeon]MBU1597400.1 ribulose-phosphate 3-epimerase [Nanoarchaeota archaeon]MBU2442367.1 ribulose-phosphate 3-epimerase [Nanoarchaeota archaeon]